MLEMVFAKILQMSLKGCCCIGIALAARLLLLRCGRRYAYWLWLLVFVSLCLPVSLPGNYSLIPGSVAKISLTELLELQEAVLETAEGSGPVSGDHGPSDDKRQALRLQTAVPQTEAPEDPPAGEAEQNIPVQVWMRDAEGLSEEQEASLPTHPSRGSRFFLNAGRIWLLGVLLLTAAVLYSICRMSLRCIYYRQTGQREGKGVVEAAGVPAPFLWGLLRPVIYLPSGLEGEERAYILAHETVHRRRMDHLARLLILAVSVLHWFNPLVWLAYALCFRDMEISCDEAVLEGSEGNIQKAYAESLLKYAARQNGYVFCPLGFGEPSVRSRIRNVLRYRKKSVWISAAAGFCVVCMAVGFLHYPAEDPSEEGVPGGYISEAEPLPEGEELPADAEEGLVVNNGGEILRVDGDLYYRSGMTLYSDGEALYFSAIGHDGKWHVCRQELDGGDPEWILDGRIVDSIESGKILYCMYQEEQKEQEYLGWYDTRTQAVGRLSSEGADYLGRNEGFLYASRREADGLHLDRIREIDLTEETDLLGRGIPAGEIMMIHGDEGRRRLVFVAGTLKGETEGFEIQCYSYDLDSKALIQKELTSLPYFAMVDGYLYFQRMRSREDPALELFRTDDTFSGEEQVGEGLTLLYADEDAHMLLAEKKTDDPDYGSIGSLVRILPEKNEERMLLDMGQMLHAPGREAIVDRVCLDWEFLRGDRIEYSELNVLEEDIYVTVEHQGSRQEEARLVVDPQGEIGVWMPERMDPGWKDTVWQTEPMIGSPIDPGKEGWDPEHAVDLREQPERLVDDPDRSEKRQTCLLGETEFWTLYGKGDGRSMLLERNGRYSGIDGPYLSGQGILPVMMEADLDYDGITELAMILHMESESGTGTDRLLVADFHDNGAWVRQFTEEELLKMTVSRAHLEPAETPTVRTVQYFFDEETQKIRVLTELAFGSGEADGPVISADVTWGKDHFELRKVRVQEQNDSASGTQ